MSAEGLASWITASRAASNVPAKVKDEGTLLQVAGMLVAAMGQQREGGGGHAASA